MVEARGAAVKVVVSALVAGEDLAVVKAAAAVASFESNRIDLAR